MNLSTLTAQLSGKTTLQQRQILERHIDDEIQMRSMICDIDDKTINLDFVGAGRVADKGEWDIQLFFDRERFGKELLSYAYGEDVEVVAKLRSTKLDYLQILAFDLLSIRKTGTTLDSRYEAKEKANSRCFIATAAYDSATATDVLVLRRFRDEVLMKLAFGREFVHLYERLSPRIAMQMRRRPMLRAAVRSCISPIARTIARLRVKIAHGRERS